MEACLALHMLICKFVISLEFNESVTGRSSQKVAVVLVWHHQIVHLLIEHAAVVRIYGIEIRWAGASLSQFWK